LRTFLDFEQSIAELEGKIEELRHLADNGEVNIADEVTKLQAKVDKELHSTYAKLSPWQKVQVARHPERPHSEDYIKALIEDFTPLAGDRRFGEDSAVLAGIGRFRGRSCIVMGHEKGGTTQSRIAHNFGMARPEGYRKAQRLMDLADRFNLPIVTLIDTPGAYPGIGAEERGQAEAIARSIEMCLQVKVPLVSVVIGEGGSGGAIALAAADNVIMLEHSIYSVISPEGCASILWRNADEAKTAADNVIMLEHSIYSVISPEGCASILWRNADEAKTAAEALRLTAQDLSKHGIVDTVLPEPVGGAHRSPDKVISAVGDTVEAALADLAPHEPALRRKRRRDKYLAIGREPAN